MWVQSCQIVLLTAPEVKSNGRWKCNERSDTVTTDVMIDDGSIAESLGLETPEEAVWDLVEKANRAGGHDNISLVVVDVSP